MLATASSHRSLFHSQALGSMSLPHGQQNELLPPSTLTGRNLIHIRTSVTLSVWWTGIWIGVMTSELHSSWWEIFTQLWGLATSTGLTTMISWGKSRPSSVQIFFFFLWLFCPRFCWSVWFVGFAVSIRRSTFLASRNSYSSPHCNRKTSTFSSICEMHTPAVSDLFFLYLSSCLFTFYCLSFPTLNSAHFRA